MSCESGWDGLGGVITLINIQASAILSLTVMLLWSGKTHKPTGIKQMSNNSQDNPFKRNKTFFNAFRPPACQAVVSFMLYDLLLAKSIIVA